MKGKNMKLDQKTLDHAQKRLEALIDLTEEARVMACNEGKTELRDKLERVGAHLRFARGEAGSLDLGGGIRTRSGDK